MDYEKRDIMITEDYVRFETAKLLKEKGFDEDIDSWYDENGKMFFQHKYDINRDWRVRANQKVYECPTLQMAMKWLREVHGFFIHIDVIREASCWLADIQDIKGDVGVYPVGNEFPNYEEACEGAVKYCLENLI